MPKGTAPRAVPFFFIEFQARDPGHSSKGMQGCAARSTVGTTGIIGSKKALKKVVYFCK
jgi:hypothetical protein